MSFYATIQGSISYEKAEHFEAALKVLKDGGWLNDKNKFVDECGNDISDVDDVSVNDRQIDIPCFCHRNLARVLERLFLGGDGKVVWTTTDGDFGAGIVTPEGDEAVDLVKWAKEHDMAPPECDPCSDEYTEWMNDVEMEFMCDVF
jgi:hypothetical protein